VTSHDLRSKTTKIMVRRKDKTMIDKAGIESPATFMVIGKPEPKHEMKGTISIYSQWYDDGELKTSTSFDFKPSSSNLDVIHTEAQVFVNEHEDEIRTFMEKHGRRL
jgi:hypothetical protein